MRMMSPKRDQRVPQATLVQQGYNMSMVPMQQQQTPPQPQYQYQGQGAMSGPPSYLPHQYAMNAGPVPGMMRVGPRMLPIGGGQPQQVGGGNGVMPQQSATIRIPVGYYSPSMIQAHQMAYSAATGNVVPIPQQPNPNQAAAYYGELMQHPMQVCGGGAMIERVGSY